MLDLCVPSNFGTFLKVENVLKDPAERIILVLTATPEMLETSLG